MTHAVGSGDGGGIGAHPFAAALRDESRRLLAAAGTNTTYPYV
jgi:hypothetical protein